MKEGREGKFGIMLQHTQPNQQSPPAITFQHSKCNVYRVWTHGEDVSELLEGLRTGDLSSRDAPSAAVRLFHW